MGCSTGPSPSTCYGHGQPGCEIYGSPKTVLVEAQVDDDYIQKFKIPDKQKYLNRREVLSANKWRKSKNTEPETRRTLLECGSGSYIGENSFRLMKTQSQHEYNNGLVLIKKCMLNDGFEYLGVFNPCITDDIEACKPNAAIPRPSTKRRLDSYYCRGYGKKALECQQSGQEHNSSHDKQPEQAVDKNPYISMREFPEKSMQLQYDIQRDSNRDMDRLLRHTVPKVSR